MLNFDFWSPTYFVFGKDTENKVGEYVQRFAGSKVLIHYGGGSIVRSGLLDRVKSSLEASNVKYVELGGVQPNPRSGLVEEGIELCRKEQVDFLLAVGGGSSIDSAKAIAMGVNYKGNFWDFFTGKAQAENVLPVATVLTLPAAGSEGSDSCVITQEDGLFKRGYSHQSLRPVFSIMNPELTYTLPPYQTVCGCADIMAHIFERYLTNTTDVGLTDKLSEAVLKTMISEIPKVLQNPDNYNSRANIMWAGTIAHNDSLGIGREQDWSSHAMEHELSALYDVAHGAGLAVVFPAFMKYTVKQDLMRYAQLAVRVWNCEMDYFNPEKTAMEGIAKLKEFWSSIGLPTTFAEIDAKEEDIPEMVGKIRLNKNGKLGNFQPLDREDITNIYKLCL